jgi:hypothetical protein
MRLAEKLDWKGLKAIFITIHHLLYFISLYCKAMSTSCAIRSRSKYFTSLGLHYLDEGSVSGVKLC